jgi:protein-S-isoprenylcysteine O-methyltransferase Ste14
MDVFLWSIAGMWAAFMAFLYIPALLTGAPAERRSSRYFRQSVMILLLALIAVTILNWYDPDLFLIRVVPDTIATSIAGVLLTAIGLGFAGWARVHLGRFWSGEVMIKIGHQLVRTGPYQFVRNPMYTGILIAFVGAAIAIGELYAFVAVGIGAMGIWMKIKAEEEILLEQFGGEYLQYQREVRRIIPFIL